MEPAFSPLDEQLHLGQSPYSTQVQRWIVRVGTDLPFRKAAQMLNELTGIVVSEATVRRWTEAIGKQAMEQDDQDAERLHRQLPAPTSTPARRVVAMDGAMVPLRHGQWAEMKAVVVGTPCPERDSVHLREMTYVARITDAETFTHLCYGAFHRRGVDGAQEVGVVSDGAEWIQHVLDAYRPEAVRILDAMHACQRLAAISQVLFPSAPEVARRWYQRAKKRLLTGDVCSLLQRLRRWRTRCPAIAAEVEYLEKRAGMIGYAQWQANGWPVGSGSVESSHRYLMQARLKGAGMHWALPQANAVLALRCMDANGRWETTLPLFLEHHRQSCFLARRTRQRARRLARRPLVPSPHPPVLPSDLPPKRSVASPSSSPHRPPPHHPWRRYRSPHQEIGITKK